VGLDWLEQQAAIINYLEKIVTYLGTNGVMMVIKGKAKPVTIRQIFTLQLKRSARKGCQLYLIQVEDNLPSSEPERLEMILDIKEYLDVFPKEISGLPRFGI